MDKTKAINQLKEEVIAFLRNHGYGNVEREAYVNGLTLNDFEPYKDLLRPSYGQEWAEIPNLIIVASNYVPTIAEMADNLSIDSLTQIVEMLFHLNKLLFED